MDRPLQLAVKSYRKAKTDLSIIIGRIGDCTKDSRNFLVNLVLGGRLLRLSQIEEIFFSSESGSIKDSDVAYCKVAELVSKGQFFPFDRG